MLQLGDACDFNADHCDVGTFCDTRPIGGAACSPRLAAGELCVSCTNGAIDSVCTDLGCADGLRCDGESQICVAR
jgi:hypothetical protein